MSHVYINTLYNTVADVATPQTSHIFNMHFIYESSDNVTEVRRLMRVAMDSVSMCYENKTKQNKT